MRVLTSLGHLGRLMHSLALLVLLVLPGAAESLRVAGPGRVALETGGELVVTRNASEPPFVLPPLAAARPLYVRDRAD